MAFPYKPVAFLTGANGPIHALAYSASPGTYILAGSADRSIRLYNPQPSTAIHPANSYITKKQQSQSQSQQHESLPEGRLIQAYQAHSHEVLSLAVASDNARFASAGGDRTVFLWDVATAQTVRRLAHATEGHVGRVNCVAMGGADDSLVVSGGFDTTVRVWDTRSGGSGGGARPVQVLDDAADAISSVVVRGAEIVAGSVDGRVRSYDVRVGKVTADVIGASVTSLCLTRDAKAMLVGSLDSRVRLMDRESGSCLRTYGGGGDDGKDGAGQEGGWRNEDFRVQSVLGGGERFVVAGDEMTGDAAGSSHAAGDGGRIWAWDLMTGKLAARVAVPWGPGGTERLKKVVGRDGKPKERRYVVSCLAWREGGFGDSFCAGGTSGAVTVFGLA